MQKQELLDREQAAKYLGVTSGTMRVWATKKIYKIPYLRVGRRVQYRKTDLDRYILDRTVFK